MSVALIRPCNARSKTITNKRFTTRNILFLIVICTSLSKVRSILADYTWYGAQKACQEKNDSLTIQETKSDEYYWTGYHERISNWIKLLGCYYDQDIVNYKHFNMFNSSAGLCQEYCTSDGYAYFAVKSGSCHCLKDPPALHPMQPQHLLCNFNCENNFDDKLSTECGGNMAFNVFGTIEEEFYDQLHHNCLAMECGNGRKSFTKQKCNADLLALCGENIAINDKYRGWRNQLEKCIDTYNTYLYGDVDVRNPASACRNIHMSFGSPHWIGVLREQYQSEDRGLGIISKNQVLSCQKCNRDGCMFTDCSEKLLNTVFCKRLTVTIPPQGLAENDQSLGSIIAPIITITIVGIIGGVLLFIYIRRKRQHTNNETRDKYPNISNNAGNKVCKNVEIKRTENKNPEYTESHDLSERDGSFDLASSYPNHGVADDNNGECSSPYNDAEEGDYDHLRETKSRQTETDDTYHHALHVHVDDSSDYDVTRRMYDQETENTYDKTGGNNLDSEYGYNEVLPTNEESPYDKTFTTSQI